MEFNFVNSSDCGDKIYGVKIEISIPCQTAALESPERGAYADIGIFKKNVQNSNRRRRLNGHNLNAQLLELIQRALAHFIIGYQQIHVFETAHMNKRDFIKL